MVVYDTVFSDTPRRKGCCPQLAVATLHFLACFGSKMSRGGGTSLSER